MTLRDDLDRTGSGKDGMAGVEGLLALPLFVMIVDICMLSPFESPPSPLEGSLRIVLFASGSVFSTSSERGRFEFEADSFTELFTSVIVRPTATAVTSGLGVEVPFGLFDADDVGLLSTTDCVEFCLARGAAGLPPFVGGGDGLLSFESGKVFRMGEEAIAGDIAFDVTVLFLQIVSE